MSECRDDIDKDVMNGDGLDGPFRSPPSYARPVVLLLVSSLVSLVIIVAMATKTGSAMLRPFYPLLITVEILFIVVLVADAGTVWWLRREGQGKKLTHVNVRTCPDYWTETTPATEGASPMCNNQYRSPIDGSTYTIVGVNKTDNVRTIDINAFNGVRSKEACKRLVNDVRAPWTDLAPYCREEL